MKKILVSIFTTIAFFNVQAQVSTTTVVGDYKIINIGDDTYDDYTHALILLHQMYNGTTLIDHNYAIGTITAMRGTSGAYNRINVVNVNTSSAYASSSGTINSYDDNSSWALKTCIYNGNMYLAVDIPYADAYHNWGYQFAGWTTSTGENMKCVPYLVNGVPVNTNLISNILDFNPNMVETHNVAGLNITGGNVGIGTTSPAHLLHVAQDVTMSTDVDVAQFAVSGASDNTKRLILGYDVNGAGFGYIKAGWYAHQWTNLSLQPNGGFVGIGTTSPGTSLDLGTALNTIKVATYNSGGTMYGIGTNNNELTFGANIGVSGVPQMVLTNAGYVGIGTTNPAQKLHVNGVVRVDATATAYNEGLSINVPQSMGGYGGITIHSTTSGSGYDASTIKWLLYHNYTPENNIGGGGFAIAQNNTNTRFYISNTGNVSIGTIDSKGYLFAVAGNAIATSMTVKLQAAWPDYVFKPSYVLPTLTEVKTYIDKNRHLPEMPSEQEIAEKGLNLGEMNKLLVKKVEELTLYLIQQKDEADKQNALKQQQIDELKKLVSSLTAASLKTQ